MKKMRIILYLCGSLGLLVYALPRLEMGQGWILPTIFGVVWISFSLLVIAAQLHHILRVDEETKKELDKIRRLRKYQLQQLVMGHSGRQHPQQRASKH